VAATDSSTRFTVPVTSVGKGLGGTSVDGRLRGLLLAGMPAAVAGMDAGDQALLPGDAAEQVIEDRPF
jgi:hypothetical protein